MDWIKRYGDLMDKDGMDPAKAASVADAEELKELIEKAKS